MEILPAASFDTRVPYPEAPEILEHEFTVVASILYDHSGPELATDRERNLVIELQEHAENEVACSAEDPKGSCKTLIRALVFDCWMFCGRADAWNWRCEDIWKAFEKSRENKPVYGLSESFRTTPEQAVEFRPPSWGTCRPYAK